MTPADLAMRSAFDESVRYVRSPPDMASAATPLLASEPEFNLTTLEPRAHRSSENVGPSLSRPVTPHVTLHQFRKHQQSPAPFSLPDLDYKRVRRKQSFTSLICPSFDLAPLPVPSTSSSPAVHSGPSHNLLPSLLPPLPLDLIPRPSTTSPSLSSTVDTLQSTPTHTPIQQDSSPFEQWRGFERFGLSEPIRTKRKFSQFKQAKRLPHHTAQRSSADCVWQVYAAVIDVGDRSVDDLRQEADDQVISSEGDSGSQRAAQAGAEERVSVKKGRSVRFEGVGPESGSEAEESRVSESLKSNREKDSTLSSNLSLLKSNFPTPPGQAWAGTFGHLAEPTPSTSPATLHYRGASFDVVNPHASLLLGGSDFETPAEIDGLLDDYFDLRHSVASMMPYADKTEEMSSSQQSLQTASSNGRRRVLYDDPDSARRTIMRMPGSVSPQAADDSPYQDSPLAHRSNGNQTSFLGPGIEGVAAPQTEFTAQRPSGTPRGLQIHPFLREALWMGPSRPETVHDEGHEPDTLSPEDDLQYAERSGGENVATASNDHVFDRVRPVERGSSLYSHSRRSNPFDLTISEDGNDPMYNNIDGVVGAGRRSNDADNDAHYDQGLDFAVCDHDGADANATQNTLEQDSTVGNIVNHYNYARAPLAQVDDDEVTLGDMLSRSPSLEFTRVRNVDPFQGPVDGSHYNTETGSFVDPRRASRMESPPSFAYGRPRPASRMSGPPSMPAPPPPIAHAQSGMQYRNFSAYADLPSTDHTYGNTGQLLQLTPREAGRAPNAGPTFASSPGLEIRGDQDLRRTRSHAYPRDAHGVPLSPVYYDDEDKENTTPPGTSGLEEGSSAGHTPILPQTWSVLQSRNRGPATANRAAPLAMPRSSSYYPDDDGSVWEDSSQASGSRANLAEPDPRPSQESYADTSICGSSHRLSLPPPPPPNTPNATTMSESLYAKFSGRAAGHSRVPVPQNVRPDWRKVAETDEKLARKILEDKILEDTILGKTGIMTPRRNRDNYTADMKELERLRKNNPSAVEKAVTSVAQKLGKLSPLKPAYTPQSSFSKTALLGSNKKAHDFASSDTQGLLSYRGSPYMRGALQFSDTAGTFQTARDTLSTVAGGSVKGYSPLSPTPVTPPAMALVRDRAPTSSTRASAKNATPETPVPESIEMKCFRNKKKQVSRVAMSSQTELQPLQLVESTATATGRLTDAQLQDAEPDFSRNGPLAAARNTHRIVRPTSFVIQQADGSAQRVSLLMRPAEARTIGVRRRQKELTRPYFRACAFFPPTALLFGLGCFDGKMRAKTNGAIIEMLPSAKREALTVYVPLGVIAYAVIGLMIALLVLLGITK